jgi:hypothetical protein
LRYGAIRHHDKIAPQQHPALPAQRRLDTVGEEPYGSHRGHRQHQRKQQNTDLACTPGAAQLLEGK